MMKCFVQLVIASSIFSLLIASPVPAAAEVGNEAVSEEESIGGRRSLEPLETSRTNDPAMTRNSVLDLTDLEQPATTVAEWVAQMEAALVQITGVRIETTETGLQVVLETTEGELSAPATETIGNALIADIPNTVLALPDGDEFSQANPIEGVALVSVTSLPNNRVRVAITGTAAPPIAEVRVEAQGLVFGVTPGTETDAAQDEDAIQVVVTGEQEEGYVVDNATTATRTDTPIRDVPQSIQVIPRQVIEDQNANTLEEVLRNVNGGGARGFGGFSGRGIFTDGATRTNDNFSYVPNLGNVERVEVLDGPASVLYGQGGPGGVVNLVTKQPLRDPFYEIEGTIGSYDDYRGSLDLTGPLNDSESILYRLNINYENSGSFIDFVDNEEFAVFPVLSLQLSENTDLVLEGSYERQSSVFTLATGLPTIGTIVTNPLGEVPRSRFLGEPEDRFNSTAINVGYRLEHEFNEDWALRNRLRATFVDFSNRGFRADSLEADNRTVIGGAFDSRLNDELYTMQTEVLGEVQTGIVQHDLLIGLELQRSIVQARRDFPTGTRSIDLFDPEYLSESEYDAIFGGFEPTAGEDTTGHTIGVYAQNLLSIGEQVKILLGGRFDQVFQNIERVPGLTSFITGDSEYSETSAFSPRVGIVYQPIQPVSLYAGWSRSFEPQSGIDREGNPFVPIRGEQFEVGVKTEFLDGRLAANLAAYQITRQNDFLPDPVDPANFSIQTGEQRSRGIEFDVVGEPLPGLRLIAGYAYTDSIVTEGTPDVEGNQLVNVPEHQANLWAVYEIQSGALEGLGLGAGLFFVGDRPRDPQNTFTIPSYLLTNAVVYYRRDNWRVQLNVDNLFDVRYFPDQTGIGVVVGEPFTIRGTVAVTF
jgi:iron complex outermembrane receptor protein